MSRIRLTKAIGARSSGLRKIQVFPDFSAVSGRRQDCEFDHEPRLIAARGAVASQPDFILNSFSHHWLVRAPRPGTSVAQSSGINARARCGQERTRMRARSFTIFPGALVAAVAGFVILLSGGKPSLAARGPLQAPQTWQSVRDEMRANGWVRVIVEIKLPARHVPEASLRNLTAVLAQRQIIAARRQRLLSRLPAGTYRVAREYLTIPYVALDVTDSALSILGVNNVDIEQVMPDAIVRPELADSVPLVQADQAWDVGFDGTGTAIAVLDTGVDRTHPFLADKVVEEACFSSTVEGASQTFCPNGQDEQRGMGSAGPCPLGDCLHGTHVAGIAAGNGTRAGQPFSGVAKGAQLIA
ncbi:MAG: hypothetical protein C5B57_06465, partial [Blastocatellia bacterium]